MPIDFFRAPKKSIWISFLSLIIFGGAFMDFYNNLNAFISSVRQRFSSKEFCETYRNSENSFTRNRKLSFPAIFSFLLFTVLMVTSCMTLSKSMPPSSPYGKE